MGFGDWLDDRAKAKAERERQEARREKQEWINDSYVKVLKCGNCGARTRVRVPKGYSVSEYASVTVCENCNLSGTLQ